MEEEPERLHPHLALSSAAEETPGTESVVDTTATGLTLRSCAGGGRLMWRQEKCLKEVDMRPCSLWGLFATLASDNWKGG